MNATNIEIELLTGIDQIDADSWNQLSGKDYPFLRHEFLSALEKSGSVCAATGWQPQHLLAYQNGLLVALMPLYIKTHSYGEYVFDWAWADAYQRHAMQYYPKLLTAIPFTPATGSRLCMSEGIDPRKLSQQIVRWVKTMAETDSYSSWHLLFPSQQEMELFSACHLSLRHGCQYHWFNRGYADFDHFLAQLSSRKRKNIRRERRRVKEQEITLKTRVAGEIQSQHLQTFYQFYQATYFKRAQRGYLSLEFFLELLTSMPEQLVLVLAYRDQHPIAGALCLRGDDTLYGRYWGCIEEYECLHFEACYYQGIDYCIAQGLKKFDPGAQGEHKISRGFEPTATHSLHWITHPGFRQAIDNFLSQEKDGMEQYIKDASELLPFKKDLK